MLQKTCGSCGRAVMDDWGEEAGDGEIYHPKCLRKQELHLARHAGGIRPIELGPQRNVLITEKREVTR